MRQTDKGIRLEHYKNKWRIVEFSYYSGRVLHVIKKEDKDWDYKSLTFYFEGYLLEYNKSKTERSKLIIKKSF